MFRVGTGGVLSQVASYTIPTYTFDGSSLPISVNSIAFLRPSGSSLAISDGFNIISFTVEAAGVLSAGTSYSPNVGPYIHTAISTMAFSPSGAYLVNANSYDYSTSIGFTVFAVGAEGAISGDVVYPILGTTLPLVMAFSPNGDYLATVKGTNDITIYSIGTNGAISAGTSYTVPAGSSGPRSVAFSPDGAYVVSANEGYESNDVTIFTVGAGGVLSEGTSYPLPIASHNPASIAFSPSGAYVVTGNDGYDDGGVTVFSFTCTSSSPSSSASPSISISSSFSPSISISGSSSASLTASPTGFYKPIG